MGNSINPLELIFNLNERLFLNSFDGVKDEDAGIRVSDHNNPFIWVATHTVWARYNMLGMLGAPTANPFAGKFESFKVYDPADGYPSLDTVKEEWKKASNLLREAVKNVTEEQLAGESPWKAPIGDDTILGTLAFLAEHESYDIGQMGFLKKFHTNDAMKYS